MTNARMLLPALAAVSLTVGCGGESAIEGVAPEPADLVLLGLHHE